MFLSVANAQDNDFGSALSLPSESVVDHGSSFPPFDASFFGSHLFWLAVSFALFYVLMARLIIPRIGSIIEGRRDRIASDLERASLLKQEADAAMELYEQQLSQARIEAHNIARAAMDEAKNSADRERAATEAALAQRLAQAENHISALQSQALQHVDTIAAEVTNAILTAMTQRKFDGATLARAVKIAAQH